MSMISYLDYLNEPTPENIQTVHKASGLLVRDAAAVAGVSYDTYKGWRKTEQSKTHRVPHVTNWNLYLYELEARRLKFTDLKSLIEYFD